MRTRSKQASRLLYLSHEVVGEKLDVTVRMVDVRPGRTDVPVGPPMRVLLPPSVFLDEAVSDMANHIWYQHLKNVAADLERQAVLGQDPLFPV